MTRHTVCVALLCAIGALPAAAQHRWAATGKQHVPQIDPVANTAWGDFDGDGDLDLAAADITRGVGIFTNDGHGRFAVPRWTAVILVSGVAAADVDGDGRADLVALSGIGNSRVLFGDGLGGFVLGADLLPSGSTAAFADIERDGDLDILLARTQMAVVVNEGQRRFTNGTITRIPGDRSGSGVTFADVDGDADADLIAVAGAGAAGGPLRVLGNDGNGVFTPLASQPPIPVWVDAFAAGDVDGDRDVDLVVLDRFGPYWLLLNTGTGAFADASTRLPPVTGAASEIALADVDEDRDLDLVLTGENAGRFAVWVNDGTGTFADASSQWVPPTPFVRSLALGDADADGDLDIATVDETSRPSLLIAEAGRYLLGNTEGVERPLVGFSHALADLDGDGDVDLFAAEPTLALNDGTGRLVHATTGRVPATSGPGASTTLGDVDNDGDIDVLIAGNRRLHLFLNDGRATFHDGTAARLPVDRFTFGRPAFADLDGDGDLDLVLPVAGRDLVWMNDGSGRFVDETAQRLPLDGDESTCVAPGDVDDDGDLDLVFGNVAGPGEQPRLLLNDGGGRFSDVTATHFPAVQLKTMTLALGDADGDGDLDLVFGNLYAPYTVLWTNVGRGRFANRFVPEAPGPVVASCMADVDDDGDLDVVLSSQSRQAGARPHLLLNNGSGTFTDASLQVQPAWGFVTAADLDRDGDTDLVFDSGVRNHRERHVSTPFLAATGAPFVIDFAAQAGHASEDHLALPVLATATLSAPLPVAWGLLFVHPGFAVTLPPVPIPAPTGEARLALPLPDDPILIGLHAHVQALIVKLSSPLLGARLTGHTADTVVR